MQVTSYFSVVHGYPKVSGIRDLNQPDFGDRVIIREEKGVRVLKLRCHAPGGDKSKARAHDHLNPEIHVYQLT